MPRKGDIRSPLDRALSHVVVDDETGCWTWTPAPASRYALMYVGVVDGKIVHRVAHKVVYEAMEGPVPPGCELDHLCRNTLCCNPGHLEPVPHGKNIRRGAGSELKVTCNHGHPYAENAILDGKVRRCGICRRDQLKRAQDKYRAGLRAQGI
jgi:hypothetical protein